MQVGVSEFAKRKGISVQAVRKAIREGRLGRAAYKKGNTYVIDYELASRLYDENTQGSKRRSAEQINIGKAAAQGKADPVIGEQAFSYSKARAYGEGFKAKLLELEFREKSGQLVRVDEVKSSTFKVVRMFRDAVQNIPIRIVNELAAVCGDLEPEKRHEMLMIMQREINSALEELADGAG